MNGKGMTSKAMFFAMAAMLAIPPVVKAGESDAPTPTAKETPTAKPAPTSESKATGGDDRAMANDASQCVQRASAAIEAATSGKEPGVPAVLLQKGIGVAVIPQGTMSAGKGLVSRRTAEGNWSAPAFVSIEGASEWTKPGNEGRDLIIVFTGADRLDALAQNAVKLGPERAMTTDAQTDGTESRTSMIYSYSREDGTFTRVALADAVLDFDDAANAQVHGKDATAEKILSGDVKANGTVQPFVKAIEQHIPKSKA
jgi:lipid-binding SYLF domain-containing protein